MKKGNNKPPFFQHDSTGDDDVEILEVVGIRDEAPDGPGSGLPSDLSPAGDEPPEIILSLDDDAPPAQPSPVPPALPTEAAGRAATERAESARLRADYDNLRKRIDRERREFELYANSSLVAGLLPVLDNLERAMAAAQGQPGAEDALREGLVLIYRQFSEALRREGLRAIEAVGMSFDPKLHEAVAMDAQSPKPPNTIVAELQRGYVFQDRVLRPAMVTVSLNRADFDRDPGDGKPR